MHHNTTHNFVEALRRMSYTDVSIANQRMIPFPQTSKVTECEEMNRIVARNGH